MRELLFWALVAGARMAWFESVGKSRPPANPFSNAMSMAGPCAWRPTPGAVGLARGPRIRLPLWSNTRMSGVKGLVADNSPPTTELVSSLHRLGRPCPDSSTNTSKRCLSPRNATAVGKFRPLLKTETSKPEGTTIFSPLPGLKKTSSPAQIGFPRVWAVASVGRVSISANKTATGNQLNRSNLLRMSTPFSALSSVAVNGISIYSLQGELRSTRSVHPREHHVGRISNRRTRRFYRRESLKHQREIMIRTEGNHDNEIGQLIHTRRSGDALHNRRGRCFDLESIRRNDYLCNFHDG